MFTGLLGCLFISNFKLQYFWQHWKAASFHGQNVLVNHWKASLRYVI